MPRMWSKGGRGSGSNQSGRGSPSTHVGSSSASAQNQHDDESENVRGANIPEPLPAHRTRIWIDHGDFNNAHVTRRMTGINRSMIDEPWITWNEIPHGRRARMWERFQGYFSWDSALDNEILRLWEKKSHKNYNDGLNTARERAGKLARDQNIPYFESDPNRDMNVLKPFNPTWLTERIWAAMIDRWNNDHWKAVSRTASKNRKTEIDGDMSKHTSGSISFAQHSARLTRQRQGVPPTAIELFDHTHRKRSNSESSSSDGGSLGDYVTSRCSRVAGGYQTNLTEKYGDDASSYPLVDAELWEQASGGSKKGRIFGFGSFGDPNLVLSGTPAPGNPPEGSSSDQNARIQALEREVSEMRELVRRFTESQQFGGNPPPPPPPEY